MFQRPCNFGLNCKKQYDSYHCKRFSHPTHPVHVPQPNVKKSRIKQICIYRDECPLRVYDDHLKLFIHPSDRVPNNKTKCSFGTDCKYAARDTDDAKLHCSFYSHPEDKNGKIMLNDLAIKNGFIFNWDDEQKLLSINGNGRVIYSDQVFFGDKKIIIGEVFSGSECFVGQDKNNACNLALKNSKIIHIEFEKIQKKDTDTPIMKLDRLKILGHLEYNFTVKENKIILTVSKNGISYNFDEVSSLNGIKRLNEINKRTKKIKQTLAERCLQYLDEMNNKYMTLSTGETIPRDPSLIINLDEDSDDDEDSDEDSDDEDSLQDIEQENIEVEQENIEIQEKTSLEQKIKNVDQETSLEQKIENVINVIGGYIDDQVIKSIMMCDLEQKSNDLINILKKMKIDNN